MSENPEKKEKAEQPEEPELTPGVAELADLLRQRDERIAELEEQVKRVAAEFHNFRRRQEEERFRFEERVKAEVLGSLLPIVDHLERAYQSARQSRDLDGLVQGIELVIRDVRKILQDHGVEPIEAEGQPFDPAFHEAMVTEEREDVPDETVVEEFQKGYRLGRRVLRPSLVKVARGNAASPDAPEEVADRG